MKSRLYLDVLGYEKICVDSMSTQKAVTDFFRRNRFEATILIAISKTPARKCRWGFYNIWGTRRKFFTDGLHGR